MSYQQNEHFEVGCSQKKSLPEIPICMDELTVLNHGCIHLMTLHPGIDTKIFDSFNQELYGNSPSEKLRLNKDNHSDIR